VRARRDLALARRHHRLELGLQPAASGERGPHVPLALGHAPLHRRQVRAERRDLARRAPRERQRPEHAGAAGRIGAHGLHGAGEDVERARDAARHHARRRGGDQRHRGGHGERHRVLLADAGLERRRRALQHHAPAVPRLARDGHRLGAAHRGHDGRALEPGRPVRRAGGRAGGRAVRRAAGCGGRLSEGPHRGVGGERAEHRRLPPDPVGAQGLRRLREDHPVGVVEHGERGAVARREHAAETTEPGEVERALGDADAAAVGEHHRRGEGHDRHRTERATDEGLRDVRVAGAHRGAEVRAVRHRREAVDDPPRARGARRAPRTTCAPPSTTPSFPATSTEEKPS
jgi:hypothetical protein